MYFPKNSLENKLIRKFSEIPSENSLNGNKKQNSFQIYKFGDMTKKIEKNYSNTIEINSFHLNDRFKLNMNNNNDDSQKSGDLTLKQQIDIISQITQKPIEDMRVGLLIKIYD